MPSDEHQQVVEFFRSVFTDDAPLLSFEDGRTMVDDYGDMFPVPEGIEVRPFAVRGIPCESMRPSDLAGDGSSPTVLYLHGGSYTAGSLVSNRAFAGRMARAFDLELITVDYRLAPEHPFPAGLDDARTVYSSLMDRMPSDNIIVAGDSAGGGLSTALLLSLRDGGEAMPRGAVLFSPWLDLTLSSGSITTCAAADPLLREASLRRSARAYAGDDLRRPLVSPVFADPAGLPPLLILVGTAEILLDDSRTFAERARAAGVDVELDVEDGLIHVWPATDGMPESTAALARVAAWISDRTTASSQRNNGEEPR